MMRMVDQFEVPDGDKFQKHEQLKIMTKDPDIVDYLKSK
jgi:ribosomal protein S15P/S13E